MRIVPCLPRSVLLSLLFLAAGTLARPAAGQGGEEDGRPSTEDATLVSPLLAPDHWAVRAAERADRMGLLRRWLPAQNAVPRRVVAAALAEAADAAEGRDAATAALARGWRERFAEEFPAAARPVPSLLAFADGAVSLGWEDREDAAAPGTGLYSFREPPAPLPDRSDPVAGLALSATLGPVAAAYAAPRLRGDDAELDAWEAVAALGPVALSAGERPVAYGWAEGRGVVLSGVLVAGAQVATLRPLRVPGVGLFALHGSVSRLEEPRHVGDPWFFSARMAYRPHPRLQFAVSRAAVFGGDSISTPTNVENVGKMLLGILSRDFENQVVAVSGRFRLPTERAVPLTLYAEWGAEDASGGWWRVPGIVAGIEAPAVPGLPQVRAGVEGAWFDRPCCGNPPWYLHATHRGGWALDGRPLGHPLGGEGWEALAFAGADLDAARLRLDGRVFLRDRSDESYLDAPERAGNQFAPDRAGRSLGGALEAAYRPSPSVDLLLGVAVEDGEGWTERHLRGSLRYFF